MKPITNEIVEELKARGLSCDQYMNDAVVKALLDADFDHDYILKSIDNGEISTLAKGKYTEKEEIEYDEGKAGEHERRDFKEGEKEGEKKEKEKIEEGEKIEKKEKDDVEKAMTADFMKSQREFMTEFSNFMADMKEMKDIMKSVQSDLQAVKDQPIPFRSVPTGALLEKSMGIKTNEEGKRILSKSQHREAIKSVMTQAFEAETNEDIKKSIANDIMGFSTGRNTLSAETMNVLNGKGIEVVD